MLYDWCIGSAGLGCIGIAGMLGWKNIFQVLKIRRVHTFARAWISGMIYAKMNRWQVFFPHKSHYFEMVFFRQALYAGSACLKKTYNFRMKVNNV